METNNGNEYFDFKIWPHRNNKLLKCPIIQTQLSLTQKPLAWRHYANVISVRIYHYDTGRSRQPTVVSRNTKSVSNLRESCFVPLFPTPWRIRPITTTNGDVLLHGCEKRWGDVLCVLSPYSKPDYSAGDFYFDLMVLLGLRPGTPLA